MRRASNSCKTLAARLVSVLATATLCAYGENAYVAQRTDESSASTARRGASGGSNAVGPEGPGVSGESSEIRQSGKTPDNQLPTFGVRGKALSVTYVAVQETVILPGVKRLGMNLGARDTYGSAQMMKNIIPNPGFESSEYGTLFHTGGDSTGDTYYQEFWDTTWNIDRWGIGQPEGFWDGGTYEVLFGAAKGRTGEIARFSHSTDNRNVFGLSDDGVPANYLDVVSARKTLEGISSYPGMDVNAIDTTTTRPGSPGTQSFRLRTPSESWMASYSLYMDSFWRDSDRASGKMMLVEGPWRLAFWAKGANAGTQIRVEFRREGEGVFFNETVTLTTEWQRFEFNRLISSGQDRKTAYTVDQYHPLLVLKYYVLTGDEAWIDDAELYRSNQTNPTAFNDALVGKLKELRPGVLRDWGNQLGSSLDNQLAEPSARKSLGWRPHQRNAGEFSYSLHEFLALCKEVSAEPWYVVPPTWTHDEMINLSEYLCAPADRSHPYAEWRAALGQTEPWSSVFPAIHLEWGNEMWGAGSGGDPFFGASALGGERLGSMAHDHFGTMRDYGPYFDPAKFDFIIGGQVGWPGRQEEIERYSSNHDTVALAPYFGSLSTAWGTDQEIFAPLLAKPFYEAAQGNMRHSANHLNSAGQGTRVSIYEINFHTTGGDVPLDICNDFVTSMAGGVAMPLFMLHYMKEFGAREQCAFQALQFSFNRGNGEHVRVWGCLRDLNLTGRKRPTWLGMEIANKAIRGDMVQTLHTGKKTSWTQSAINSVYSPTTVEHVQSYAFKDGSAYGIVLFNLGLTDSQRVRIAMPNTPGSVAKEYRLSAESPHDDNEDTENVVIKASTVTKLRQFHYTTLPPCSVYVLTWNSAV